MHDTYLLTYLLTYLVKPLKEKTKYYEIAMWFAEIIINF